MSSMVEIQDAIEKLSLDQQKALTAWLESRIEPGMSPDEETALLASLDKAARQLDNGQGVSIEDARAMVPKRVTR